MKCKCGCGQEVKLGNQFIKGHNVKLWIGEKNPCWILREIRKCACGCGGTFECKINSEQRYIGRHSRRGVKCLKEIIEKISIGNMQFHTDNPEAGKEKEVTEEEVGEERKDIKEKEFN